VPAPLLWRLDHHDLQVGEPAAPSLAPRRFAAIAAICCLANARAVSSTMTPLGDPSKKNPSADEHSE
jgi:hypothetical protein